MFTRRRRRRSTFAKRTPPQVRYILYGLGAAVFLGAFVFLIRQADELAPEPEPMRIELPDAFSQ
jgi:hypothetical protein